MALDSLRTVIMAYMIAFLKFAEAFGEIVEEYADKIEKKLFPEHRRNNRAQASIGNSVNLIVNIVVAGILAAFLLPIAIDELVAVDTSSWGNAESSIFGILPLFFVMGVMLYVVSMGMSAGDQ